MKKALILLVCSVAFLGGALLWPSASGVSGHCEQDECDDFLWWSWCESNSGRLTQCDVQEDGECVTDRCDVGVE